MKKICGNILLQKEEKIKSGCITIEKGKIIKIDFNQEKYDKYILPGLIDSHVHIESSMLTPDKFGELAIKNGTIAIITDPHEIANVLGIDGIKFMMENSKNTPLKIFFAAPSCVPATNFETSGAIITHKEIEKLFQQYPEKIIALAEVMNFPGVIYKDPEVISKIKIAKKYNKRIDGHAPGLSGENLIKYVKAGVETDHECSTIKEAEEKIKLGMKIQIREGSAAKDFDSLYPIIEKYTDKVMLCTDDSHPDELTELGEINKIIKKGIKQNINIFKLIKTANLNPITHYNIPVGKLEVNDPADFIIVDNLQDFNIISTYINGKETYNKQIDNQINNNTISHNINKFKAKPIQETDLQIKCEKESKVKVNIIQAEDGKLTTKKITDYLDCKNGIIEANQKKDILKIVVLNRYTSNAKPAIGFIKGFNIKNGAIGSTIAHDSHNIIAVGTDDKFITQAINTLIEMKGGLVAINNIYSKTLQLEIGGLMTSKNGYQVAKIYKELNETVKNMGSTFKAPFMTLAFMALLVIPEIKLSDKGLFDGNKFQFINTICE